MPTPLGGYVPDWAVLIETEGGERLYFVVETKGSLYVGDLTNSESAKIECGRAHFEALRVRDAPVKYFVARSFDDVLDRVE